MCWLIIIVLAGNPCIDIKSGMVVIEDSEGKREISVDTGTYCPEDTAKALARKLVDKNSKIKKLEIILDTLDQKYDREVKHWLEVEDRWADSHKACRIENMALKSFWNKWGKTILIAGLSAAAAAAGTYLLIKADVIPVR
jgi:hypothetical protein